MFNAAFVRGLFYLLNLKFLLKEKKFILAESPIMQRPLTDVNQTINTNESEVDIIVANGNYYTQDSFFSLPRSVCNKCPTISLDKILVYIIIK